MFSPEYTGQCIVYRCVYTVNYSRKSLVGIHLLAGGRTQRRIQSENSFFSLFSPRILCPGASLSLSLCLFARNFRTSSMVISRVNPLAEPQSSSRGGDHSRLEKTMTCSTLILASPSAFKSKVPRSFSYSRTVVPPVHSFAYLRITINEIMNSAVVLISFPAYIWFVNANKRLSWSADREREVLVWYERRSRVHVRTYSINYLDVVQRDSLLLFRADLLRLWILRGVYSAVWPKTRVGRRKKNNIRQCAYQFCAGNLISENICKP